MCCVAGECAVGRRESDARLVRLARRNYNDSRNCQSIKRLDLLFGDIFTRFQGSGQQGLFLELLEPFILNDKLMSLNPAVMQAFVEHYSEKRMLRRVEQCILHMDIASLDFHQVATLLPRFASLRVAISLSFSSFWPLFLS